MASIAMPRWLRVTLVAGVVVLVAGAGLFAYRWYSRPTTLTIAVGSLDGEAPKLVSALASRLAEANAPVRLKLVETASAIEAADLFSSNKRSAAGEENALDVTTLNVAAHRLQSLIHDRRILLAAQPGGKFQA